MERIDAAPERGGSLERLSVSSDGFGLMRRGAPQKSETGKTIEVLYESSPRVGKAGDVGRTVGKVAAERRVRRKGVLATAWMLPCTA